MLRFVDLESTGLDTGRDRIVEIALCDEAGDVLLHSLVNPGRPISPEAIAVHGITDEMVAEAPGFAVLAPQVQGLIEGAVLVGYAHRAFDVLMLDAELRRTKQPGIDLDTVQEVDLYRAWKELEPRTLAGAFQRYLGVVLPEEERHRAVKDTVRLPDLLAAMAEHHGVTVEDLVRLSRPADECDRSGKFKVGEDRIVRFAFGKFEGEPAREQIDYLLWMRDKGDFSADTMKVVNRIIRRVRQAGGVSTGDMMASEALEEATWD